MEAENSNGNGNYNGNGNNKRKRDDKEEDDNEIVTMADILELQQVCIILLAEYILYYYHPVSTLINRQINQRN